MYLHSTVNFPFGVSSTEFSRLRNTGDLVLSAHDHPEEPVNQWNNCVVIWLASCLSIGAQH